MPRKCRKIQENTRFYINQIKYSEKRILILFSIFIQFSCAFLGTKRREGREKKERKKERKKKEVPPGNSPSLKSHARRPMMKATILCMMACYRVGIVIFFLWLSLSLSKTLKHSLSLSLWNSEILWNSLTPLLFIYKKREEKKRREAVTEWKSKLNKL